MASIQRRVQEFIISYAQFENSACFFLDSFLSTVISRVFRKDCGGPRHQPGAPGSKHSPQREAGPHGTAQQYTCMHVKSSKHTVQEQKKWPPTQVLFSAERCEVNYIQRKTQSSENNPSKMNFHKMCIMLNVCWNSDILQRF